MGTLSIDAQQSAQITKLQEDVEELTTKLNSAVADIGTIKGKVDTLITDVTTLKDRIGTTYPASGSGNYDSASDTIMERIYQIDKDVSLLSGTLNSHISIHPGTGNQGSAGRSQGGSGALTTLNSLSTSSTGSVTQTASNASTTGIYTTSSTNVVTIETDAASRAREVATSTLTKLRDL